MTHDRQVLSRQERRGRASLWQWFLIASSFVSPVRAAGAPPAWTLPPHAPARAPNIVLILIDDVGFGATATFGGPISTPVFSALAADGLKFNNFHVNPMCSPSRASLLTGRNAHQVGFGDITGWASPTPGFNTELPSNVTPLAAVLRDNGYSTAAFGKWHNTPYWQVSPAGPFNLWPTGRWGFDYFYGFLKANDNQYYPRLYRDTVPVEPPALPAQGYHLTNDIASDAIKWLHQHDAVAHDKPFFVYFATGATHEPHQVPPNWITKYKGRFDAGWDVVRAQAFAQQKRLGIIPADAAPTPRPPGLPAWDALSPDEKKLLAHEMEVYAAFTEQTDHEVGRVLDAIRAEGEADNTVVLEIFGDNGASAEGGIDGRDALGLTGKSRSVVERLRTADELGSEMFLNHYAAAWAWALTSPFQGAKQDAAHLGGTTDPLVISWPGHLTETGRMRTQFSHLTDVAPTLFELAGITPPPRAADGTAELPLPGVSLAYVFEHPDAPSRHDVQYFSQDGNRGIYSHGWWAGDLYQESWDATPRPFIEQGAPEPHVHPWELYDLAHDYAQAHDLAARDPDKLRELQALFAKEAKRNNALPLHPNRVAYPVGADGGQRHFVYRAGDERIVSVLGPDFGRHAYRIDADIVVPASGGASGVILADGGRYGGLSLSIEQGHAIFVANSFGNIEGRLVSSGTLAPGRHHLAVDIVPEGATVSPKARPGTARLSVDGSAAIEVKLANTIVVEGETLDIGADLGTPVGSDYQSPARFTGTIELVVVDQTDR